MTTKIALLLLVAGILTVGCGSSAPDNKDQVNKIQALDKASKDSMAKDGIHSE